MQFSQLINLVALLIGVTSALPTNTTTDSLNKLPKAFTMVHEMTDPKRTAHPASSRPASGTQRCQHATAPDSHTQPWLKTYLLPCVRDNCVVDCPNCIGDSSIWMTITCGG
ncbi:hypothetical protein B0H63DRAFT_523737 [Podospora didyma]|uniref:Uncharacterized protein n=1 Tax=Podospora didyma TaxID=330526 RepID=A0AAE0NGC8_9PEZI|nr:hypothetical protein B0H63DRAFT_523737 [Podospora didyma]